MRYTESRLSKCLMCANGLILVLLAQLIGGLIAAVYFFILACFFLVYSEIIIRQQKTLNILVDKIEPALHDKSLNFERIKIRRPYKDTFIFYLLFGIMFAFSSIFIASLICIVFSVGKFLLVLAGK